MSFLQKITARSWEHAGEMEGIHGGSFASGAARSTGLKLFLAVISSLFFLFIVSYNLRMELPDWRPLTDPLILWVNTVFLVLGSIALQVSLGAAKREEAARLRFALAAGAVCTVVFLAGQFVAWRQLLASGFYATVNPSYAFFYLLTGLHAAHLAGGLWVLVQTTRKAWAGAEAGAMRTSIGLCALYWHYLLLVWLVMFGLLLST